MLSLDLFNSRYEKKLHEGAVDDAEYARLKKLGEKIDYLKQARAKTTDPEMRHAIDGRIKEYNDERMEILSVRGMKEAEQTAQPQTQQTKGIGDTQDPKTKMAQLSQQAKKGPLANVGAGLKGFLTGKEEPLDEQELGRRGIGVRNMKSLEATIRQGLAKAVFQFPKVRPMATDEEDSDKLADYYNGLDSAGRTNFVYNVLGDPMKFVTLCKSLNIQLIPIGAIQPDLPGIPSQGEIQLEEKKSQKKKFKSALAQRELEKAMAAEPTAGDPIEAFILKSIENDQAQSQQLQDLETQLQAIKTSQGPAPTADVQKPAVTATPISAPGKAAEIKPTVAPVAPQMPSELPVPTAEPAPVPADLTKKDQKILTRVKSIEKRLKDRVDAYQDARAQQDKATLQQQINALQAQAKQQASKLSSSGRLALGQDDFYDIEASLIREPVNEPIVVQSQRAAESRIKEHGGGIGPRQHWQDLMQEGQPQELINRYLAIDAENDVDAVRSAIQAISRDPALSVTSKSRLLGQIGMIIKRHRLPIGRAYYQFMRQFMEAVELDRTRVPDYPQDPATVKHRLDTAKAILSDPRSDADSRREAAGIVAKLDKKVVAETVTNVKAGMAEIYRRLAPKIERHRDSFLAGQLYDELENYAELHGAEREFKQMMNGARNRAHMEYDTNPGGFHNWFWFLPFEDEQLDEIDRRGFLKGLGATAGLAAMGGAKAATSPDDPSWSKVGQRFDSSITTSQQVKQVPGQQPTVSSRIADVKGPNAKGEYLVTVVHDDDIVSNYVTKTPPKSWMRGTQKPYPQVEGMAEGTDVAEAISKKDLISRLQKDLPKVNDPKNKDAEPVKWTGPGKDDYGYTGYQGHGMPTDKAERARIRADKKKGVAESADDIKKRMSKLEALALAANRAGDDAKCKMYQQKIQSLKQKLSQSMAEGKIKDIDIMRQDLDSMSDLQFLRAHGMKKDQFKYKYRDLLKPAPQQDVPVQESLRPGEYHIHTVYFKDGTKKRLRVTSDEFDVVGYYKQRGQAVDRVDYDYQIHSDMSEQFATPGTTIPRKSVIQGYTVFFNPKTQVVSVTRGGDSEEAAIEQARVGTPSLKNFRQAADRLIDKIESDLNEAKDIQTREDFIKERDRLLRMIGIETDPANKQILKSAIRQLENRAENEGWITIQSRMVREDSDGGEAVEMAIMRRMLVAHTDLIIEFGLDKVVQAIEEVAYNVGDTDEIGSSDVSGWVRQVKQILGADA